MNLGRRAVLTAILAAGCRPEGPAALITVEDPSGAAQTADRVEIWTTADPELRVVRETGGRPLPLTFVFEGATGAHELWVEALAGEQRLADGRAAVPLFDGRLTAGVVELRGLCQDDLDCDDGVFCNGVERCRDQRCGPGNPPCDPGARSCVASQCDEARGSCALTIDPDLIDGDPCTISLCNEAGPVQVAVEDGQPCTREFTAGDAGLCISGVCEPSFCGDQRVDPRLGESCDSGAAVATCVDCQLRVRRISVAADGSELRQGAELFAMSRSGRWLAYGTEARPDQTGHGEPLFGGAAERLAVLFDFEADAALNLGFVEVHAIAASGLVLASDDEVLAVLDPIRRTFETIERPTGLRDANLSADGRTVALALGGQSPVVLWEAPFRSTRILDPAAFADSVSISADGGTLALADESRGVGVVHDLRAATSTTFLPAGAGPEFRLRSPVFVSPEGDAVAFANTAEGTQSWLWRRGEGAANEGLGQPCAVGWGSDRLAIAHDFALWAQTSGTAERERLSSAPDGTRVAHARPWCAMPDDGRMIAFDSAVGIYVAGDGNAARDVFVLSF